MKDDIKSAFSRLVSGEIPVPPCGSFDRAFIFYEPRHIVSDSGERKGGKYLYHSQHFAICQQRILNFAVQSLELLCILLIHDERLGTGHVSRQGWERDRRLQEVSQRLHLIHELEREHICR
jgi:hypothetical protein